ncbi:MAG: hypothetical protein ACOH1J_09300, partial [Microbacteriaceae bacterium]
RLPVIWMTGLVLRSVGRILGTSSTSEDAARARLARIAAAAGDVNTSRSEVFTQVRTGKK